MSADARPQINKPHFAFVDMMRGMLALYIMACHWCLFFGVELFPSTYLAVDYFFMMSGFMIAFAYQDKLRNGKKASVFLVERISRLYPAVIAGALLGFSFSALESMHTSGSFDNELWGLLGLNLLMIPLSLNMTAFAYPLNVPMWFLFFLGLSYVVFALFLHSARNRLIAMITLVTGVLMSVWFRAMFGPDPVVMNETVYELSYFWRSGFSFCVGVLLFRGFGLIQKVHLQAWMFMAIAIFPLAFMILRRDLMPWWGYEAVYLVIFPISFAAGLRVVMKGRIAKFSKFAGDLSFPLYVTHMPLLFFAEAGLNALGVVEPSHKLWAAFLVLPATIVIVFFIYRLIDVFVRLGVKSTGLLTGGTRAQRS